MNTETDSTLCFECGKPAAGQLICPGCGIVQRVTQEEPDFFSLFGLPRKLAIDVADLERRYYALSRQVHPDLFQGRSQAEQSASVRFTALVNRAYRALKDPVRRALYWLTLNGEALGRDNQRVPSDVSALVFEVQEKLEELRQSRDPGLVHETSEIHRALLERMAAVEERLCETFVRSDHADGNGAGTLAETKAVLSELHYLRTLARDVEKELAPEWNES